MKINIEVTPEEAAELWQRFSGQGSMPTAQPRSAAFWDVLAGASDPAAFQPQPTLPALPPAPMFPAMPQEDALTISPAPATEIVPIVYTERRRNRPVFAQIRLASAWLSVLAQKVIANPIEVVLVFVALGLLWVLIFPPKVSPPATPQSSSGATYPPYPAQPG